MAGFPVTDQNTDFFKRIYEEGFQLDGTFFKYPTNYLFNGLQNPEVDGGNVGTDASNIVLASQNVANLVGKMHVLFNINLWASKDVYVHFNTGMVNGGFRSVVGRTGYNDEKLRLVYPNDNIGATLRGCPDLLPAAPNNKVVVVGSWECIKISLDTNYNAKKSILILGDSNTEGSFYTLPATKEDLWHWKLRNQFLLWGNDVRLIDKSWAGKSSVTFESYRINGKLDLSTPPDLVLYDLGTNDFASVSNYQSNLSKFLTWAKGNTINKGVWPNTKIIVTGPIPKRTQETEMDAIRLAGQTVVNSFNNVNIVFINLKDSFDINNDIYYSSPGSPNNDGTHLSPTGQTAKANYIISQINNNYPSFIKI